MEGFKSSRSSATDTSAIGPMATGPAVLLVEDDPAVASLVEPYLRASALSVTVATTAEAARNAFRAGSPDVVVLDLTLPDADGLDLVREFTATGRSRLIIVSGKLEETDRIVGIELGADDYLTKPFSLRELLARVRALLRRGPPLEARPESGEDGVRRLGALSINIASRSATLAGKPVQLTRGEFDLLLLLVEAAGAPVGTEEIAVRVLNRHHVDSSRTVAQMVHLLRTKISRESASTGGIKIEAVRHQGYRIFSVQA